MNSKCKLCSYSLDFIHHLPGPIKAVAAVVAVVELVVVPGSGVFVVELPGAGIGVDELPRFGALIVVDTIGGSTKTGAVTSGDSTMIGALLPATAGGNFMLDITLSGEFGGTAITGAPLSRMLDGN